MWVGWKLLVSWLSMIFAILIKYVCHTQNLKLSILLWCFLRVENFNCILINQKQVNLAHATLSLCFNKGLALWCYNATFFTLKSNCPGETSKNIEYSRKIMWKGSFLWGMIPQWINTEWAAMGTNSLNNSVKYFVVYC